MPFIEKCLMPGNRAPPRRRAWTSTKSMSLPINAVSASSGDITWFQPFTNSAFRGSARFSGEPKMCLLAAITGMLDRGVFAGDLGCDPSAGGSWSSDGVGAAGWRRSARAWKG